MKRRSRNSPQFLSIEEAFTVLRGPNEVHSFLNAMLSEREYNQLKKRWRAYQLRARGVTLAKVVGQARVAMATATRAAKLVRTSARFLNDVIARGSAPRLDQSR